MKISVQSRYLLRLVAASICAAVIGLFITGEAVAETPTKSDSKTTYWLEGSLKRVFPKSPAGAKELQLIAPRNGRVSFQACFRNDRLQMTHVECKLAGAEEFKPQVRFVGLVPLHHITVNTELKELEDPKYIPGLVPDTLWPLTNVEAPPTESRSFWITLNIPADAKPGVQEIKVRLSSDKGEKVELPVKLEISELVLKPRDFPVIHWWRPEATWNYYKTGMFDERWWQITRAQMENMLAHGSDVVYVPVLFNLRTVFKQPGQMLIVNETQPGVYNFDWKHVKRFTDMCKEIGFRQFEWSHLWSCFTVAHPSMVYKKVGNDYVPLWTADHPALSSTYTNFLKQYLSELHKFLVQEKLLEHSYFHLADEPEGKHIENYRKARQFLKENAPWMHVMDALSDIRYGKENLTDMPIPLVDAAQGYIDAKIPHWVYYCCVPQGPYVNRFLDTPLPKVRMAGWLFYRLEARGFLHWGYNYWNKIDLEVVTDPFTDSSGGCWPGIPYGDPFVIYPGPDGKPVDSIRWEVFAESLQDYSILQSAGIKPGDAVLSEIKTYADFPKTEQWIEKTREKILRSKFPTGSSPAKAALNN